MEDLILFNAEKERSAEKFVANIHKKIRNALVTFGYTYITLFLYKILQSS